MPNSMRPSSQGRPPASPLYGSSAPYNVVALKVPSATCDISGIPGPLSLGLRSCVSKQLVQAVAPAGTVVLENLTSDTPTTLAESGLPFFLVFRAEPGKKDILLKITSAYAAASQRRIPPPAFGPLPR